MSTTSYELAKQIVEVIEKKKIVDLDVLDVQEITPLADIFIIAVASNVKQTQAIADHVEELLEECNQPLINKEGYNTATWILMDCGEVIVHILEEEQAEFYSLTRLWNDAKKVEYLVEKSYN